MLRTGRLTLSPWGKEHLDDALRLWGDPQVMALLGGPLVRDQIEARLLNEIDSQVRHGFQYWRLTDQDGFAGCCGLKPNDGDGEPVVVLGFHLLPRTWGL